MNWNFFNMAMSFLVAGQLVAVSAAAQEKDRTAGDALLIAAQKICPVSGGDLRAMGEPIKAKMGDQIVFLCCKACRGKSVSKENWDKVTAHLAAAQGRCPVMNRPLPQGAKSVVVNGRRVFVCCPPCTGKIQADPEKYLKVVDALLAKNVGRPHDE